MARVSAIESALAAVIDAVSITGYKLGFPVPALREALTADVIEPGQVKHLSYVIEPSSTVPIERTRAGGQVRTDMNILVGFQLRPGLGSGGKPVDKRLARSLGEDIALALMLTDGGPADWSTDLVSIDVDGPDATGESVLIRIAIAVIHKLGA